ncbi:cardiolipin synthase [Salinicoccus sp. ID82-1]|uniref:cardiolipin synthase n=1 Tax=Salinicoccus sp. ID82-1 TaxID=2820269 RepID=UPI001F020C79|nr:cardiolipin synthase [Salinicoccus sp. ID82-1]MCG1009358.1 cardiolipin synthase [Salinicoccus sp. ID82-1]
MFFFDWQWWNTVSNIALIINIILAVVMIVFEDKKASSIWAWLMVLFFIPVIGFFLYLLLGRSTGQQKWSDSDDLPSKNLIEKQKAQFNDDKLFTPGSVPERFNALIGMLMRNDDSVFSKNNSVRMFTAGEDKFEALFDDIDSAEHHIHMEYYIMRDDQLGRRLRDILTRKAEEGVKVRFLYDGIGSRKIGKKFFSELRKHGGETKSFSSVVSALMRFRLNFRNHRKLVVIDGAIGYTGGYNVGDEYLGRSSKFGFWRDTHLRMEGQSVHLLQERFISDWNKYGRDDSIPFEDQYFPPPGPGGDMPLQIVSSGPDSEGGEIMHGFIKAIQEAEDYIYIQSPYFIPSSGILASLRVAALSGIDVSIMIPNKPDHPFVYPTTFSFSAEMMKAGAKIHIYDNGFLHAKTMVIDDKISTVGTANVDIRSSELNFEMNTFIYSEDFAAEMKSTFEADMEQSRQLTREMYESRSYYQKFKEHASRLLSPLL